MSERYVTDSQRRGYLEDTVSGETFGPEGASWRLNALEAENAEWKANFESMELAGAEQAKRADENAEEIAKLKARCEHEQTIYGLLCEVCNFDAPWSDDLRSRVEEALDARDAALAEEEER